jgi:hypothetical protein
MTARKVRHAQTGCVIDSMEKSAMNKTHAFRKTSHLMLLAACGSGMLMLTNHAVAATPASGGQVAATAASAQTKGDVAGDFEGKAVTSKRYGTMVRSHGRAIGWGWAATDDSRMRGHSTASIGLVHPGAKGSQGALEVKGELKSGFIAPWAGAVWFPGNQPMQPADLSDRKALTFWVRGKPGSYSVMLMSGSGKSIPQYANFTITKDWRQIRIPLQSSFPGADFKHVYFIAFSAGGLGKFQFDLDRVTLTR